MPRLDKLNHFQEQTGQPSFSNNGHSPQKTDTQSVENLNGSSVDFTPHLKESLYSLSQVVLTQKTRSQADRVLTEIKHHELIYTGLKMGDIHKTDKAIALNLYGPPGTGKSITAQAIAYELGLKVLQVPSLQDKHVGVTEKNIEALFAFAEQYKPLIIWDEADRDFGKRLEHVNQAADVGVNSARSVLLERISAYDGIVCLTTNLVSNYDSAFISRIRYEIEFELPDEAAREQILLAQVTEEVKQHFDESVNFNQLAAQFDGISGRDIKKAVLNALVSAISEQEEQLPNFVLSQSHFIEAIEEIIAANQAAQKKESKLIPVEGVVKPEAPEA